ncbi:hypothetical protein [Ktedonobacter robiniae]|uniref:hypothetical protein n=1 Tax=Ktedonobacter robiniae TaxID=2778365 RepID=UPI0019163D2E|nr:hypothetical protein [Ktedonobacter robiniae]
MYKRILQRYVLPEYVAPFLQELARAPHVHIRLEPGTLRAWDFADLANFVR